MSLFYFQSSIIYEQQDKLKIEYNKYCEIYHNLCEEIKKFNENISTENEEDETFKPVREKFEGIAKKFEKNIENLRMFLEVIPSICECIEGYEYSAVSKAECTEYAENKTAEEAAITEGIPENAAVGVFDVRFNSLEDDEESEVLLNDDILYSSESSGFSDYLADDMGASSVYADDAVSEVFTETENTEDAELSESISSLSFSGNADFMNGFLSVAGNSLKNNRNVMAALLISSLSSLLAGGLFKILRSKSELNDDILEF